jgi:hypothetical protein
MRRRRGRAVPLGIGCAAVALAATLAACGVEQGRAASGSPGVRVEVPDGWRQITVCTGEGVATAALPSRVELDGPRELRNIDLPAQGTFAWGYSPDRSIRYDLYAIRGVWHLGNSSDEGVGRQTVLHLNGIPEYVEFRNVEERGDHVIGTYDEWFSDRDFRMRFVADRGSVVAVGVGIYENSSPGIIARAKRDLNVMWQSLEVAGVDGAPTGACEGPSDEPR